MPPGMLLGWIAPWGAPIQNLDGFSRCIHPWPSLQVRTVVQAMSIAHRTTIGARWCRWGTGFVILWVSTEFLLLVSRTLPGFWIRYTRFRVDLGFRGPSFRFGNLISNDFVEDFHYQASIHHLCTLRHVICRRWLVTTFDSIFAVSGKQFPRLLQLMLLRNF